MHSRLSLVIISLFVFVVISSSATAIVIRHDVPDAEYLVVEDEFPALVDLPDEGHGVLIGRRWIVTAAHATQWRPIEQVTINEQRRAILAVVVHPGYQKAPQKLESGDAAPLMAFRQAHDDVALIKLAEPVEDVEPVALYRASDEKGKLVKIYGKGATGNGVSGQERGSPHRGKLRRAYNFVLNAEDRWLSFGFDSAAHPKEGIPGDGDSGGPVLIDDHGSWKLAGLTSWKFASGELSGFRPGLYGQISYEVRISHYADWIDRVTAAEKPNHAMQPRASRFPILNFQITSTFQLQFQLAVLSGG